ncbi:hypothetical protein [Acinetobacter pittii]|uniref:Uncharacterized protein n=1 Tax=Acinetobacter pittii TaxID=48296 RepID=A0AB33BDH7_ACIPI|nr:hypothetical protein [Acinetobacter pittii]AMX20171.1 hypothetical protein IEC338SC_3056 [Acinetobacter pittii]MDO0888524.1 hypothetical protein [Acinetobacter pittii]OCY87955.1 hypothetical protein BFR67_17410 [Acinetobacter pittii]
MNDYQMMLKEIEQKKAQLEQELMQLVSDKVNEWQSENNLPIKSIYIDLADVTSLGGNKKYIVSGASVDIDYKP